MEKGLSNILLQYHSDRREDSGRGIGLSMSNALQVPDYRALVTKSFTITAINNGICTTLIKL